MSQLRPDDYQNKQTQGCAPCWARASAGIIGPCPSCFRKQNPNPYRDQDGTATKVDPRLHELNRSMTDAERKLVEAGAKLGHVMGLVGVELKPPDGLGVAQEVRAVFDACKAVAAERKPPEPRPITPEELAVVEAAKRLESESAEWEAKGWSFTKLHKDLCVAARALK